MPPASRQRRAVRQAGPTTGMPTWIAPHLSKLAETAPDGDRWIREIKLDGYRMHGRLDRGQVKLLTCTGLDWTEKYPTTANVLKAIRSEQAYIDGELCGVAENGVTSFSLMQAATDNRHPRTRDHTSPNRSRALLAVGNRSLCIAVMAAAFR